MLRKDADEYANGLFTNKLNAHKYKGLKQAHTGKKTWEFSWSNISSTFKGNLETFRNAVGGNFNSFTYNDGSSSYTVRMSQDSLQFTESLFERFSTSIKLREVSPSWLIT